MNQSVRPEFLIIILKIYLEGRFSKQYISSQRWRDAAVIEATEALLDAVQNNSTALSDFIKIPFFTKFVEFDEFMSSYVYENLLLSGLGDADLAEAIAPYTLTRHRGQS